MGMTAAAALVRPKASAELSDFGKAGEESLVRALHWARAHNAQLRLPAGDYPALALLKEAFGHSREVSTVPTGLHLSKDVVLDFSIVSA